MSRPAPRSDGDLYHRLFARWYPRIARSADRKGGDEHRRELLAGLTGRVVEVGAGHGPNFAWYPDSVTEVVAVEPEPRLRRHAEDAAASAPVPVRVVPGRAEQLPDEASGVDAAVLSLVLCSLPDVDGALGELRRTLPEGGELRFYEHVRSEGRWAAVAQRIADVAWPRVAGGCHLSRSSVDAIEAAGFEVVSLRRFRFLGIPHVIGRARVARAVPSRHRADPVRSR